MTWLANTRGLQFSGYEKLREWSVADLATFWASVWDFFGLGEHRSPEHVLIGHEMPGYRWFPNARVNYAEHVFRDRTSDAIMMSSYSQTRDPVVLTARELAEQVGRARRGLQCLGVERGDRVVGYLPNIAETVIAFLATASLGAVWSSCSPEFGVRSVIDRFKQVTPRVLLVVDGYRYGDRHVDRLAEIAAIQSALPSLRATICIPYLNGECVPPQSSISWDEFVTEPGPLVFDAVAFDHPLYVLYSSGTTGLPKPIVHGHGGILIEHVKALGLHLDLGSSDRFFWQTTTGWMMWNYLISGLLLGARIVCFDGNPSYPDLRTLWRLVERERVSYFGTSAGFILACRRAGLRPGNEQDLTSIRGLGSTGSPLSADGFRWVYEAVGTNLLLASASGGTDVCTAFVGMAPLLPVRAGEISCRYLGAKVEAFDPAGHPVIGQQGELVVTAPMPSMPVGFWGDHDGAAYKAAYFAEYPGVWRHGDWITISDNGACVITGRSDATLNRGGVRLGTSEFYEVVEGIPGVDDSLVVHLQDDVDGLGELWLFVVTGDGYVLDEPLRLAINSALRTALSPRHIPDEIRAVPAIPRTLSGKKLEVPVKRILQGVPAESTTSLAALANPESLIAYEAVAINRAKHARIGEIEED